MEKYKGLLHNRPQLAVYFEGAEDESDIMLDVQALKMPLDYNSKRQIDNLVRLNFELCTTRAYMYCFKIESQMSKSKCCHAIVTQYSRTAKHNECVCMCCDRITETYRRDDRADEIKTVQIEDIMIQIEALQMVVIRGIDAAEEIEQLKLKIAA